MKQLTWRTRTRWGRLGMVGTTGGERYYWFVKRFRSGGPVVSMMPACVVEPEYGPLKGLTAEKEA